MSTVKGPLKYTWTGYFDDGKILEQPEDDRYSKHDDNAEHNPSSFRDLLDHMDKAKLIYFDINDGTFAYGVDLPTGRFGINGTWFSLESLEEPLTDRKLVYWRGVQRDDVIESVDVQQEDGTITKEVVTTQGEPYVDGYFFGYEGKNRSGNNVQKVIRVD